MTTAAELETSDNEQLPPPKLSDFAEGMLVMHPEYGAGQLTSVSGSGDKTTCKVQFFQSSETVTFRLKFSPLRPLRSSD